MIVVRIELWPHGDARRKRDLGTAFIVNDGSGTRTLGRYEVMLSKWGSAGEIWRVGRVDGFDRLRGSPWTLLSRAINAALSRKGESADLRRRMRLVSRAAMNGQISLTEEDDDGATDVYGSPEGDEDPGGGAR